MAGKIDILKIVDSHLVLHLLAPGETDASSKEGIVLTGGAASDGVLDEDVDAAQGADADASRGEDAGVAQGAGAYVAHGEGAGAFGDGVWADMGADAAGEDGGVPADVDAALRRSAADAPGVGADADALADALVIGRDFMPDNLVEDFVDEASDMIDEVSEEYADYAGWEKPLLFGFVDGVLSVSNDSYTTLEDSYYEDAANSDFAAIDDAIDRLASQFDGERAWDEAAKGHVRAELARAKADPAKLDLAFWSVYAHGFMYGADAAYDLEWKVIVTPANNALLTDEDAISEAAMARMQAESGGVSLFDRVLNMIGIDPDELAAALGVDEDTDDTDNEVSNS